MTPPTVLYNTYMQPIANYYIDTMSKVHIICELILGLNRLPVFGNVKFIYVLLAMVWSVLVQIVVILVFLTGNQLASINIVVAGNLSQVVFITMFSFISWKRMHLYYSELNKFDTEVGYRPSIPKGSINNFIFLILNVVSFLILFYLCHQYSNFLIHDSPMLVIHALHAFEVHYFGHLLNLLTPRLRLINYFMELSLSNIKDSTGPDIKEFTIFKKVENKSNCEMKKLMNLYHTIIRAYDFLTEAIKWQLLLIIAVSFITILGLNYYCFHEAISNRITVQSFVADSGVSVLIMLSLFSPCVFGDRIHNEVRRLRELLAARLYETKIDKSCRSIARALLAFTETRDLSFSLLRMLKIDISLPFKFVGLVVTYLIILLQFEKVLNP